MNKNGIHIISDFIDCQCDNSLLEYYLFFQKWIIKVIEYNNLTPIDSLFFSFGEGNGFTGMVILAESHISIHTWPEYKKVNLDIYVCNLTTDNSEKAKNIHKELSKLFQPKQDNINIIDRI